jgi:hypothetical protein
MPLHRPIHPICCPFLRARWIAFPPIYLLFFFFMNISITLTLACKTVFAAISMPVRRWRAFSLVGK